jgi:hypothetical protein
MLNSTWKQAERLWKKLETVPPGTKEYTEILDELMTIISIQETLYDRVKPRWYEEVLKSPAFIGGFFQIGATILVINHERIGIITSRAFNWIRLGR